MRRRYALATPLVSLSLIAAWCGTTAVSNASAGSSQSTLNFATVAPFTGPAAAIGQAIGAACWPATVTINNAGGIMGHKFTCTDVDTKGDPADAVPNVAKLLATDSGLVGVVGPTSGEATAVIPLINSAHIPMLTVAGQSIFDRSNYQYLYRPGPPDAVQGFAQALWAKHLGITRVALVYASDSGSQGDKPGAVTGWRKLGGKIVADVNLDPDQPSYRTEATKVLAGHPQVIFTESDGPTAVTFFSELSQLNKGKLIPTIGTQSTQDPSYVHPLVSALGLRAVQKAFYFMTLGSSSGPAVAVRLYNQSLLASKGHLANPAQFENFVALHTLYDGVVAYGLAMVEARSTKPSQFNRYITAVLNPGPGKVIVHTFAAGKAALNAGKHIRYVGAGGALDFNQYRNSFGNVGVVQITTPTTYHTVGQLTFNQLTSLG